MVEQKCNVSPIFRSLFLSFHEVEVEGGALGETPGGVGGVTDIVL